MNKKRDSCEYVLCPIIDKTEKNGLQCFGCGFNPKVEKERKKLIRNGAMRKGADGLLRLYIRKL